MTYPHGLPKKLHFAIGSIAAESTTEIPLNTWTHVTGVYNGTDIRTYINGTQDGTPAPHTGTIPNSSNDLRIGADSVAYPSTELNGKMDEVIIYNTALNATEVQQLCETHASNIGITCGA